MVNSGPARSQYWPSPRHTCFLGGWTCVSASYKTEKKIIKKGENLANLEPEEKFARLVFSVAEALQEFFNNRMFDGLCLMKILKMRNFHLERFRFRSKFIVQNSRVLQPESINQPWSAICVGNLSMCVLIIASMRTWKNFHCTGSPQNKYLIQC